MAGKGGKRVGAGRKPKAVEEDLAGFWREAITPEKRLALVDRFYEIAMGDNLKAAVSAGALLLAYSIGKPTEKHEHAGDGGGPITLRVVYDSKP
jgi:hypothetical protein